jgi:hypothetical protein
MKQEIEASFLNIDINQIRKKLKNIGANKIHILTFFKQKIKSLTFKNIAEELKPYKKDNYEKLIKKKYIKIYIKNILFLNSKIKYFI